MLSVVVAELNEVESLEIGGAVFDEDEPDEARIALMGSLGRVGERIT
jgi:hypothetical protein